jgi:hypothetical protein
VAHIGEELRLVLACLFKLPALVLDFHRAGIYRQANRTGANLRGSGGHRYRERAAV